jgi:hypothetical protein
MECRWVMKKVPCSGPGCSDRRRHYESDEPRGTIYVEVPDEYDGPAFCSIECWNYSKHELQKDRELNETSSI